MGIYGNRNYGTPIYFPGSLELRWQAEWALIAVMRQGRWPDVNRIRVQSAHLMVTTAVTIAVGI